MKTRVDFGQFLKKKREAANVTQADISQKLGHSTPQFVSNIERGICAMPLHAIPLWAKIIKVPPTEIFRARAQVVVASMEQQFKRGAREQRRTQD